ncbi:MAG: hypothetical protein C0392_14850 [Syntrophus sp. (in: bacteria)]|nr:hypothetical protein [Syntrophus sp. (in: bacteria)]
MLPSRGWADGVGLYDFCDRPGLGSDGNGGRVSRWPVIKLKDCCEIKGGKRLPKGEKFTDNEGYPYIRARLIQMLNIFFYLNDLQDHNKVLLFLC